MYGTCILLLLVCVTGVCVFPVFCTVGSALKFKQSQKPSWRFLCCPFGAVNAVQPQSALKTAAMISGFHFFLFLKPPEVPDFCWVSFTVFSWNGLTPSLHRFINHSPFRVDTTRVEFTISLRENWSLPFLALQVTAITCYLRPQLTTLQQVSAALRTRSEL